MTLVTPSGDIAEFTHYTLEYEHIQFRLRTLGVDIICNKQIRNVDKGKVNLACVYVDTQTEIEVGTVIPVTSRRTQDVLYTTLKTQQAEWSRHGIKSVRAIGDCYAPATIAMAVYGGHEYARTLEQTPEQANFFRRELGLGGE